MKGKKRFLDELNLEPRDYAVLTMHRPDNVDSPKTLRKIIETHDENKGISNNFSSSPTNYEENKGSRSAKKMSKESNVRSIKPVKYHEMLMLMKEAKIVFTDSGGIQKETFWLQTPCATLRDQTQWIETVDLGANVLVEVDPKKILLETERILRKKT